MDRSKRLNLLKASYIYSFGFEAIEDPAKSPIIGRVLLWQTTEDTYHSVVQINSTEIAASLKESTSVLTNESPLPLELQPASIFTFMSGITITPEEIECAIDRLSNNSAPGPDGICPQLLKTTKPIIACILAATLEQSLDTGIIPDDWKIIRVVPEASSLQSELSLLKAATDGITLLGVPPAGFACTSATCTGGSGSCTRVVKSLRLLRLYGPIFPYCENGTRMIQFDLVNRGGGIQITFPWQFVCPAHGGTIGLAVGFTRITVPLRVDGSGGEAKLFYEGPATPVAIEKIHLRLTGAGKPLEDAFDLIGKLAPTHQREEWNRLFFTTLYEVFEKIL
ncbi:hypothetical protein HPB51_007657 [Rhipicephalus microplus]|uniref:Uncharacterized protein n=1 Tax=Rhipicephalus microplus TaxID=6941 RepID=A0A9J6DZM4_RHIMP|nr:hypothetical protein HPB51_007657 [Rhipicephalus microplus]